MKGFGTLELSTYYEIGSDIQFLKWRLRRILGSLKIFYAFLK